MAGYFPPRFNMWCQVWRPSPAPTYVLYGWSKCQMRGPTSHVDSGGLLYEVLFPKHSDVRSYTLPGDQESDVLVLGGWDRRYGVVAYVTDKGAGFANEYRLTYVSWRTHTTIIPPVPGGCPSVDPLLIPPMGYTPLPLISPAAVWPVVFPL